MADSDARGGSLGWLRRRDPRAVTVALVVYILCVVLTPSGAWHRMLGLAGVLVPVVLVARLPVAVALSRLALLLPIALLVATSALLTPPQAPGDTLTLAWPHREVSLHHAVRMCSALAGAGLSVLYVSAVARIVGLDGISRALGGLGLPRLLTMLLTLTGRYLALLASEARRMVRARDARGGVRGFRRGARVAGAMVGSLFVRSLGRADRISDAMLARGFSGTLPTLTRPRLTPADVALCAVFCATSVVIARPWAGP